MYILLYSPPTMHTYPEESLQLLFRDFTDLKNLQLYFKVFKPKVFNNQNKTKNTSENIFCIIRYELLKVVKEGTKPAKGDSMSGYF